MKLFSKKLIISFFLFAAINIFLYLFIIKFNPLFPFQKDNYIYNSHHYLKDPRINGSNFQFIRALGQYDAQWYLKIGDRGYPKNPKNINLDDKKTMDGLTYAFFPLYPLVLHVANYLFRNIELTAFVVSNIFLILNFFSLYFVISSIYPNDKSKTNIYRHSGNPAKAGASRIWRGCWTSQYDVNSIAIKSIFLLFLFPFSIFFRSYFTEGMYLFLLIWFAYFLIKKKFLFSAICLAFLNVVKANGFLLNFLLFYFLYKEVKEKKMSLKKAFVLTIVLMLPFLSWIIFNYFQTGNFFYFNEAQTSFFTPKMFVPLYNFSAVFSIPWLNFHSYHSSIVDLFFVIYVLLILKISKKSLDSRLWWISFLIWLSPLLIKDIMSFPRYQLVSFPLFVYFASKLRTRNYFIVITLLLFGLFIISIYFVNWYWVG